MNDSGPVSFLFRGLDGCFTLFAFFGFLYLIATAAELAQKGMSKEESKDEGNYSI